MAEQAKTRAASKRAAPKKTAAKRGPTTRRKPAPKRKTTARTTRATSRRGASGRSTGNIAARAQSAGRNAFLAGLGFYGKAYDGAQERFEGLQDRLQQRRKRADKLYRELVKRGEKVERDARNTFSDMELPRLELDTLTDRKQLEASLERARARFAELRESVGLRSAA